MTTETAINLTDSAKRHIETVLAKDTDGIGLRVGVKTTGCSGYQYVIETAKTVNDEEKMIESNGIKIIIDDQSLRYLAGTELDFYTQRFECWF